MAIRMIRSQAPRFVVIAVMGMLGALSGVALHTQAAPPRVAELATWVLRPAPPTLDDLVADSDLIVVGTVGALMREAAFAGYDEQGRLIQAHDQELPPGAEIPFFDYVLHVDQILKEHGTLRPGQDMTLRMFTKTHPRIAGSSRAIPGARHLFLLKHNPDRETYGLHYGTAAQLTIDGPVVTQTDGQGSPLPYPVSRDPATFLQIIRETVRHQALSATASSDG